MFLWKRKNCDGQGEAANAGKEDRRKDEGRKRRREERTVSNHKEGVKMKEDEGKLPTIRREQEGRKMKEASKEERKDMLLTCKRNYGTDSGH